MGFGDLAPTSQYSRFVSVLFIPLVTLTMARCIQLVANTIIDRRRSRIIQSLGMRRPLKIQDLEDMSSARSSDPHLQQLVSWSDFLEMMLLTMHKVDKRILVELRSHFDRLDVDQSGYLDRKDLIERAKKELPSPRRKIELALFMKRVLNPSERELFMQIQRQKPPQQKQEQLQQQPTRQQQSDQRHPQQKKTNVRKYRPPLRRRRSLRNRHRRRLRRNYSSSQEEEVEEGDVASLRTESTASSQKTDPLLPLSESESSY